MASASISEVCIFQLHQTVEDASSGTYAALTASVEQRHRQELVDLSWLPNDNGILISSHLHGKVHLWETLLLRIVETIELGYEIHCHAMSPSLNITHSNLAIARQNGVTLVDLVTGSAIHTIPSKEAHPRSLLWDSHNEFNLYGGLDDGSIMCWDIRRPSGNPRSVLSLNRPTQGSIIQLSSIGPELITAVSSEGFLLAVRASASEPDMLWCSELAVYCMEGFRAAIVEDTQAPLMILPSSDCIFAYDLSDGSELWTKPCLGFQTDALIYNSCRSELYSYSYNAEKIQAFSI